MSEINSPNISSQLASVDDHEWYHSENDKEPIVKKSECLKKKVIDSFYFMQALTIAVCHDFPPTSKRLHPTHPSCD